MAAALCVTLAVPEIFYKSLKAFKNFDRCAFALLACSATGSARRQTAYSAISAYGLVNMKLLVYANSSGFMAAALCVTLAVPEIFYKSLKAFKNFDRCAFALLACSATGSARRQTAYSAISAYGCVKTETLSTLIEYQFSF